MMTQRTKPAVRPGNPNFSSGPCAKRPGWSVAALENALLGRSHRSGEGREKLAEVIDRTRAILSIPDDYHIGIVGGSDTGAVEMAMWCLLGQRCVDMLAWENFGKGWVTDVAKHLKLDDMRTIDAPYGALPDLDFVNSDHDVVFTWNGTASGVRVPNGDWIADSRGGLTICDATSAVFAMPLPWTKLDVITWSWQKVLGGEAQHGMLVLSPRAVERLESYVPPWPLPKLFRLTRNGALIEGVFRGDTINTPSMLCVEDALDALRWAEQVGGLEGMIKRSAANLAAMEDWVAQTAWVRFLAVDPATRSSTSICLTFADPSVTGLPDADQKALARAMTGLLAADGVAYDIEAYRDAPPGLRIWGGSTVETADILALLPWLDWAYAEASHAQQVTA